MDVTNPKLILAGALVAMLGSGTNSAYTWKVNNNTHANKVEVSKQEQSIETLEEKQKQIADDTRFIRDWVIKQQAKESTN